jgi:MoxR-like ATPase
MHDTLSRIRRNLGTVIKGKDDRVTLLLAALLARGHVLIEDMPGLGKTTLAKVLARSIDASFNRVQFTPDLLPTDVLGGSVYNPRDGAFIFHRGPVFTNILLADEINRASPRTQSSLLEAMAERQVTIEGICHPLPALFIVVAPQNPIEFHGTYPLPEAQLDRFLIRMDMGYTDEQTEVEMLYDQQQRHPLDCVQPVVTTADIEHAQGRVAQVHVARELGQYAVDLVRGTREHEQVQVGSSPRGALGLFRIAQALAALDGRDHALPDDMQAAAVPVLSHRIVLQPKARHGGIDKAAVIRQIVESIKVPV